MSRVENLQRAKELLMSAMEGLDLGLRRCSCCGLRAYGNYDHYQTNEMLKGAISRIDKAIFNLEKESKNT